MRPKMKSTRGINGVTAKDLDSYDEIVKSESPWKIDCSIYDSSILANYGDVRIDQWENWW